MSCLLRPLRQTSKLWPFVRPYFKKTPYLFLDRPESHLHTEQVEYFLKALTFELNEHRRMAIVRPIESETWLSVATKSMEMDQKEIILTPLVRQHLREKFLLSDQKESQKVQELPGHLIFHLPSDRKKAA